MAPLASPGSTAGSVCVTCPLRITSGVTPADLLAATWQPSQTLPHTCENWELETGTLYCHRQSVRPGRRSTD